jgi:hypothetical protein
MRQEDLKVKVSLGYIMRPCLKKKVSGHLVLGSFCPSVSRIQIPGELLQRKSGFGRWTLSRTIVPGGTDNIVPIKT